MNKVLVLVLVVAITGLVWFGFHKVKDSLQPAKMNYDSYEIPDVVKGFAFCGDGLLIGVDFNRKAYPNFWFGDINGACHLIVSDLGEGAKVEFVGDEPPITCWSGNSFFEKSDCFDEAEKLRKKAE